MTLKILCRREKANCKSNERALREEVRKYVIVDWYSCITNIIEAGISNMEEGFYILNNDSYVTAKDYLHKSTSKFKLDLCVMQKRILQNIKVIVSLEWSRIGTIIRKIKKYTLIK